MWIWIEDKELLKLLGNTEDRGAPEPPPKTKQGGSKRGRGTITDWDKQPLGQMSDLALARQIGCSPMTVMKHRHARGIPAYRKHDWDSQPLGKMPDYRIAAKMGVSPSQVGNARERRGIPSYRDQQAAKLSEPKPAPQLSVDDQAEIRALARGGIGFEALSDKYNVSEEIIAEVVHKRGLFACA